jgi:hypothetical protein
MSKEPKQELEKEMFELEQELDIPSSLRWHNSKPKQETLEEVAEKWVFETNGHKWSNNDDTAGDNFASFIAGAKWQQEQDKNKYSEEEVCSIVFELLNNLGEPETIFQNWFEQFKKKEMSYANNEITLEDVFNDEKKKNLKEFIDKHKKKK